MEETYWLTFLGHPVVRDYLESCRVESNEIERNCFALTYGCLGGAVVRASDF